MTLQSSNNLIASLDNPFAEKDEQQFEVPGQIAGDFIAPRAEDVDREGAQWDDGVVTYAKGTTESLEQAFQRAGGKVGHKGFESAQALIEMIDLRRRMQESGS